MMNLEFTSQQFKTGRNDWGYKWNKIDYGWPLKLGGEFNKVYNIQLEVFYNNIFLKRRTSTLKKNLILGKMERFGNAQPCFHVARAAGAELRCREDAVHETSSCQAPLHVYLSHSLCLHTCLSPWALVTSWWYFPSFVFCVLPRQLTSTPGEAGQGGLSALSLLSQWVSRKSFFYAMNSF